MPKFQVRRSVDAFVHYIAEVEANSAVEASKFARSNESDPGISWKVVGIEHFDAREFSTLDSSGDEIPGTTFGDF